MSWQDSWRRQAWGWAQRLDRVAVGWLQLARHGKVDSAAIETKRKLVLKVRGWIYEVIEHFLGGVNKLPNRVPLGALPHLVVGGAVVVTVATIGAWISNEEARLVEARRLFAQTVAEEARKTDDPAVRRKLGKLVDAVADDGPSWGWLLAALGVATGVELLRRRLS